MAAGMQMWRLPDGRRWVGLTVGQADPEWQFQLLAAVGENSALRGGPGELRAADRCAPGRIRTCDTGFRRAVLYPLSYWGRGAVSQAPDGEQGSGSGVREWSAGGPGRRGGDGWIRTRGFVSPGPG
ncbi:hypothetical protein SBRY_30235 [Actinacidiphila bryophytorum]|uniref:Uncharacterized protein n=1 Tax=Actinacidiphila bryophytorum TaxID=1436133 RepID=A0A9W4H0N2_9ACTN|nr:hypothetical protein SBRY_30235 [Actinacidiphila bryophytorum]